MKRRNRIKVALQRGFARTFVVAPVVFLLVAGAGCPSLFESTTHRATHIRQAVAGSDGIGTIDSLNTVVNVYAPLTGTVDPVAGDKTITVTGASFLSAVSQGDLLLIVQMAGATINTTEAAAYGTVTNLGSAGRYELIGVEGVAGGVITLACGLKNGYSRSGKTQVIRVPQYTTLTINSGASITAPAWDGTTGTGGVVAVHAQSTVQLQLNGSIDVSAKGFRGGAALATKTSAAAGSGIAIYRSTAETDGAEKGEGIAGYPPDFTTGQYGRGAPANGGGGGDSHNAGGGGGANARSGDTWTGQGVMLATVAGAAAWGLDPGDINNPAGANTRANSEGGGRGGYSYSNAALDPLTSGPDLVTWAGDNRREVGGLGGHPLDGDPAARLFMGGGGGAGDGNNGVAGHGGRGGGLIFIIAGAVAGSGAMHADGEVGGSSTGAAGTAGDAGGGGGGGGTVVVISGSIPATIAMTAKGGAGGDHTNSLNADEVEGPGGGGGGGYIAVSGGSPTLSAAGALGGTTTVATSAMNNFRTNGATAGHDGLTNDSASTFLFCGGVFTTIKTHPASHSKLTTGSFTFTNTANPVTYECKLDTPSGTGTWVACNTSDPSTPAYTTGTLTDGTYTLSVRGTDSYGNPAENPPATYTWNVDTVPPVTTIATHPTDPSSSPTGSFTFTNSESAVTYECKLDSADWAPCNAGDPSSASYTTGLLPDGSHTLSVRSTDQAGNLEQGPPYVSFPWTIQAGALDAGTYDAEGALDSGAVEVPPALEDAEGIDALANDDLLGKDDVAAPDLAADKILVVGDDTAPVVGLDAAVDVEKQDVLPVFFDAGDALDTKALASDGLNADVLADALADVQSYGAEPNPDTAGPVVNDDAAPVVPPATEDLKILGSGFCAIASPRSTSSMPFLVMALAALTLLGRRRKQ